MTIFAAGYPEGHVESQSLSDDLKNLKTKVDAGVDFILTQVVFSSETYVKFVESCRELGIKVPIIPGLYVPRNLQELEFFLKLTKVSIDSKIHENFKNFENDEEGFKILALQFTRKLIDNIKHLVPGFHFFTMNDFEMVARLVECKNFSSV